MPEATIKVEYGLMEWMVVKYKLWAQQCSILLLKLVVIHSSNNKTEEVDGFAIIFDGI